MGISLISIIHLTRIRPNSVHYSAALILLQEAVVEIINNGIIDGGFKSLAQISANTLADPGLEQAEFLETRDQLTFRE